MMVIFIFVEGPDDRRFVESVISPRIGGGTETIRTIPTASEGKDDVREWVRTAQRPQHRCLFLVDNDGCPEGARLQGVCAKRPELRAGSVDVVVQTIEAWYLAGLTQPHERQLHVTHVAHTNDVDEAKWSALTERARRLLRDDLKLEILARYSLSHAITRNQSLNSFIAKYGVDVTR